jgi:hypothetical protein
MTLNHKRQNLAGQSAGDEDVEIEKRNATTIIDTAASE